ncbi:efflux RND transporter periplasmic adaptor subunit [Pararhizobium antarcticum]|uniref:Efflux transporter periplasmic adaptor subunit n=1 Tax=Pararhizobium antarcticum TaxID=1798805 RepID=A0A657LS95_9HYPH|nr:efflux RND transporter periplasmic adaptor subunit [Pararhizobium antarcticum]OJF96077.1 efflux transporter periplasmic adaptor subunit [Pararhizobium antarcticum]OJG01292.1 efflux transporter periplasmic adaptor subunit [Rhizobium sp. 58]
MFFQAAQIRTTLKASVLLAAMAGLAGCSEEAPETRAEVIRPVKVMTVSEAQTGRDLEYSGAIRARTEMALGFRVGGKITERLVDIGGRVNKGDVLARIDTTDYALSVLTAQANLAAAERQVETAELTRRRANELFDKQVSPKSQLEQAQLSYNQAVSTRDAARSSLEQARNQVSYGALQADRNGIVTAVNAEAGQVVAAGNPVVTIAADGEKEVQVAVPETDILAFKPGKTVKVAIWSNSGELLQGKVREVAGSADPQSRTFAIRISLPENTPALLGMTASVSTAADAGPSLIAVPLSALAKDGEKALVWTVDPASETVHARPVEIADFAGTQARIAQGLKPGDIIVTAGTQFMREDLKVKLPQASLNQQASATDDIATAKRIR